MFSLYTTEENLIQMCLEAGFWFDIIRKLKCVYVTTSSNNEEWDVGNDVLSALHRSGIMLEVNNELEKNIRKDHSNVYSLPNPVYLLDIEKEEAQKIEEEYGVICKPIAERNEMALTEPGWDINTSDKSKTQSWNFFLSGIKAPLNAIVIVDRYFFASEYKYKETIDVSLKNLKQILETLLPKKAKDENIAVTIVYDHSTINVMNKCDKEYEKFKNLITEVNKVKKSISRPYAFSLELISLTDDCYHYEDTHDRFIISNYFIVNATHKIKAFQERDICTQILYFNYLFSKGIKPGEKSSIPMITQEYVLSAIRESLLISKNEIQHGCNGQTSKIGEFSIKNRLLQ